MSATAYDIYQELEVLPESQLAEVKQFVEFIKFKKQMDDESKNLHLARHDIKKFAGTWSSMGDEQFTQSEHESIANQPTKTLIGIHEGKIVIHGDIIEPIDVEWDAMQ